MPHSVRLALALKAAADKLKSAAIEQAHLEAEILLAHVLNVTRTFLFANPDHNLSTNEYELFTKLIARRLKGEPVAYLTGYKEFWSLLFWVAPAVLIPRPETELLVEQLLLKVNKPLARIADLGTGSGAIALSIAHERPSWEIHATDRLLAALNVAKENAQRLALSNVAFHLGDWCEALPPFKFDAIISNPPYIAADDSSCSEHVRQFEPQSALFADDNGLNDLQTIIQTAKPYLLPGGLLLLEHGYQQAGEVRKLLAIGGYNNIKCYQDFAGNDRVTIATR